MPTAPLSLFKLLVHFSSGVDPHLQPGVHLRWFSAPPLNLPAAPYEVERADASEFNKFFSQDISWFNRFGQGIPAPVTLVAGQEAFGLLPAGEDVLAVQVLLLPSLAPGLKVIGEAATPNGYQPVAVMAKNGWLLTPGIQRLHLIGPGRVQGVNWIRLSSFQPKLKFESISQVGLPSGPTNRYVGTPDFSNAAVNRVMNGAPLRRGLQDDPGAISAAAAAPITPDEERERVLSLVRPDLEKTLEILLNDSTEIPIRLISKEDLNGGVTGEMPLLASLLSALIDPSIARYLGYAEFNKKPLSGMTLFRVSGLFRTDEIDRELLSIAQRNFLPDGDKIILQAYCLAHPDPLFSPPRLENAGSFSAQPGDWISGGANLVRRAILPLRLPPGQVDFLALRRGKPGSASFSSLNDVNPAGAHLPLAAKKPENSADARFRRLRDASVPPEPQEYGLAVADVFGRWSDWAVAQLPAGELVPPPAPMLEAAYIPAAREPVNDIPRQGKVRCRIRLPLEPSPGIPAIISATFRLLQVAEDRTETLLLTKVIPISPAMKLAEHLFTGPALNHGVNIRLLVRANLKAGALLSPDSAAPLDAADPRPPAPLVIVPDLHFATRPDAANLSTVRLQWTRGSGHTAYRIYRSSQRALEPFLVALGPAGSQALALVRDPRASLTAIATALQVHAAAFPKDSFELLTRQLVLPGPAGSCTFTTSLPGHSRILYIYRLLAVNAAAVEEDWAGTPALLYFAVPPSIKLQPPTVEVAQVGNTLRVIVQPGSGQPAGGLRIFRSTNPNAALNQMSLLVEDEMPQPVNGVQTFTLQDSGTSQFNPAGQLKEWSVYTYRAQIRALQTPNDPPGLWSDPSAPTSIPFIPPAAPPSPAITHLARSGVQVELAWENPSLRIRATPYGNHQYRILRVSVKGGFMQEIASQDSLLPAVFTDSNAPPDVIYVVETVDPRGRRAASAPSAAV